MSSASVALGRSAPARWRRFVWVHPEWWAVALCWCGWAALLVESWNHFGHNSHHRMSFAREVSCWMLMVVAMMLPFMLPAVRTAAVGSPWARRHRAIAGFLIGFFAPWLASGVLAAAFRHQAWAHTSLAAAFGFGAAALWQRTQSHRRAIMACHRVEPLSPFGWQANVDCLRFGALVGTACLWSCWPLMLACTFTGHNPFAIAAGMIVGIAERWYYRPRTRVMLVVTLALALTYLTLAAWHPSPAIAANAPELIGSSDGPFVLGPGLSRIFLNLHPSAGPHGRVFLNIERMVSNQSSGPFDVYLNLPQNAAPGQHPELAVGELPMFGLMEANRSDANNASQGLYQQLEVTKIYARLPTLPGWNSHRLAVTFVPRYPGKTKIQVSRATLFIEVR